MVVKKDLILAICKLSKSDWDKLKVDIDFLYAKETRKMANQIFIDSQDIEEQLKYVPVPIQLDLVNKEK